MATGHHPAVPVPPPLFTVYHLLGAFIISNKMMNMEPAVDDYEFCVYKRMLGTTTQQQASEEQEQQPQL